MRVLQAVVAAGRVEIPSEVARDGDRVTVLAEEAASASPLTPVEISELAAAYDEIQRGDFEPGADLIAELRRGAAA